MPLNDPNQGKHAAVIIQNQSTIPTVTKDLVNLFSMNSSSNAGTQPQIFAQIPKFLPNGGNNNPMQLTYNSVNTSAPIYYSFLPGGYLIYFGSAVTVGAIPNGAVTVTLSPTPTSILCVQGTPTGTSTISSFPNTPYDVSAVVTQPGTILLSSRRAPNGSTILWLAIGKQ